MEFIKLVNELAPYWAQSHLEGWAERYKGYTKADLKYDLEVNHDISIEVENIESELGRKITDKEQNYLEKVFIKEVLKQYKRKGKKFESISKTIKLIESISGKKVELKENFNDKNVHVTVYSRHDEEHYTFTQAFRNVEELDSSINEYIKNELGIRRAEVIISDSGDYLTNEEIDWLEDEGYTVE